MGFALPQVPALLRLGSLGTPAVFASIQAPQGLQGVFGARPQWGALSRSSWPQGQQQQRGRAGNKENFDYATRARCQALMLEVGTGFLIDWQKFPGTFGPEQGSGAPPVLR